MAKISPTSIKYSIIANFVAEGPFQKPDVIGALFGQTEGLLGSDMELRELQKEGKIGRIEVDLTTRRELMSRIDPLVTSTPIPVYEDDPRTSARIGLRGRAD